MPDQGENPDDDVVWLTIEESSSPRHQTNHSAKFFLLVALAVVVSVGAVGGVIWKLRSLSESRDRTVSCAARRSTPQLIRETTTAFSSFDAAEDPVLDLAGSALEERVAINNFFESLEAAVAAEDHEAFRKLVDHDRLLKRIELTGCLVGWSSLDKRYVRSELKNSVDFDSRWSDITVANVLAAVGDSDSRVVYAYCRDEENDEYSEHRMFISETGDGWKLYDWVRLDLGLSESEEWSVYIKYVDNQLRENFDRWGEMVSEADELAINNDYEAVKEKLKFAEAISVPPEVEDFCWVTTGYRWQAYGYDEDAQRCFENVRSPDRTPGAYFGLLSLQRWSDPTKALANANKYESTVGPTPELCQYKAQLLRRLNRRQEAIEAWKNLLRILPENTIALSGIYDAIPADEKGTFDDYLKERNIPVAKVAEVANSVAYSDYPGFLHLVNYLRKHDASSAQTIFLQGLAKELDGQYLAAAEFYMRAHADAEDDPTRQTYASSYIQAMAEGGQLLAGWRKSPDRIRAFETIVILYDDGDIALSQEEYRQLVELFRQEHPDEVSGLLHAASIAFDAEQYSEVENLLRTPRADGSTDDDDDYVPIQRDYMLCSAIYRQERLAEAYAVSDDRSERFAQLVVLATQQERWDDIRSLLKLHASNQPDDPFLSYARGELAAHEEQWEEAINHYVQALKKSGTEEPWTIDNRLLGVCVESNRWRDYYQYKEDKSEAFYSLATRFVDEQNWDALTQLLYHHRRQQPDDPQLIQIEASSAWEREDYSSFITSAELALKSDDADALAPYQRYLLEQRLRIALLRNKDYFKARKRAIAELTDENDGTSLAILNAAQGNLRDASDLAINVAKESDSAGVFYSNDDVGATFLKSDFSKLHEQYPVSLAYGNAPVLAVFHSDEPWVLDGAIITAAMNKLGVKTQAKPEPIEVFGEQEVNGFVLRFSTGSIWIATGAERLAIPRQTADENHALASLVNDPKGSLVIGTAAWTAPLRKQSEQLARSLTVQLVENRNAVLFVEADDPWEPQLAYPVSESLMASWGSTGKVKAFKKTGVALEADEDPDEVEKDRIARSKLFEAVRSFEAEAKTTELELLVHMGKAIACDPLWVKASKANRTYGSLEIEGTLQDQSKLIPELRPGLRVSIPVDDIEEWRLLRGERELADGRSR